jgi:hypothetical protein
MLMDEEHVKYGNNYIVVGDWDPEGGYQTLVMVPPCGKTCEIFLLGGFDYGGGIDYILTVEYDEMEEILESVDHPARFKEYFENKINGMRSLSGFLWKMGDPRLETVFRS